MTHEHREVISTPSSGAAVDRVTATAYDPYAGRRQSSRRLVQAIYLLFGVIEGLIAIRFVLLVLGASPAAGFSTFIYGITAPLIAPFVGLFGTPRFDGSVIEWHSLVAVVVYALLAWLIAKVVWLLVGETRSAATTASSSTEEHIR